MIEAGCQLNLALDPEALATLDRVIVAFEAVSNGEAIRRSVQALAHRKVALDEGYVEHDPSKGARKRKLHLRVTKGVRASIDAFQAESGSTQARVVSRALAITDFLLERREALRSGPEALSPTHPKRLRLEALLA